MPVKRTVKKTTTKKATAKKATAKKTAVKKVAAKKAVVKKTAVRKVKTTAIKAPFKKTELMTELAETTELSKKQVASVFETLGVLMQRHLKKGGAGEFTLPGILKCVVKRKPATRARKGVNPFTGEEMTFKAKPACNVVKIRALKKLKEMVK